MAKAKMSKRNRSVLIGLICGICCAVCVGAYVAHVDAQANAAQAEILSKYGGDQIEVCVARRNIGAGETITESDIEMKTWVASLLPADAVTDKKEAVGQQLGSTILAGEVISRARFGFESADIDIPDGLTALSVPARDVQAVGGALSAGMKTDVYAIGGDSTVRIASSVLVLATSATADRASSSNAWITLAVAPSQVEEMVSAAQNLELYFVLPSQGGVSWER